ncbi:MAG: hypothetical protein JWQ33_1810, partial [Ramlibacter sp.]|nr:hypothetical protein [Ramlibacter sp.]
MLSRTAAGDGADRQARTPPVARDAAPGEFASDMQRALSGTPRAISPKYFYDARGSQLFDAICELPEYYPTRTELRILRSHADEIAAQMGPQAEIVEFGAGSCAKVGLLLDA